MSCPYIGLVPLSQEDQSLFAGRDKEIDLVISSLYVSSLTLLYGESGVGKTSLIRAGLLPKLEHPEHRVLAILFREWQPPEFEVNLRNATLQSLLTTINRLRTQGDPSSPSLDWDDFLEAFRQGLNLSDRKMNLTTVTDLYALPLDRFIKECCAAFYGRLFFVFDQFEEYIYYHPLREKGDHFDGELARAINDKSVPASFLISLREDGLGKLNRLHGRIPDLLANVIKLEHLDESGANEAIKKPLAVFNKRDGCTVEFSPELVKTLLEQANADRLELDEPAYSESNEIARPDIGSSYKALALQAVLVRLWKVSVEPSLSEDCQNGKKILISRDALTQLGQGRSEGEDEVRFAVRTYFDQQLQLLDENIREDAAEILPHMIRAASQKKARTVKALTNESGIPEDRVMKALEKLKEKPVNLVREISGGGKMLYELQHDAVAFAVQDWCIRQRQMIREKRMQQDFADRQAQQETEFKKRRNRLFWYTFIGTAVVSLLVTISVMLINKGNEAARAVANNISAKINLTEMEIEMAIDSGGAAEYNPASCVLNGIDFVSYCLKVRNPIPVRALLALRVGTLQIGHPPTEAQHNVDSVWHQIPAMESPDRKYLLAIEPGNQISVFKYNDDSWKPISYSLSGRAPFEIASSNDSKDLDRIGLRSSDGVVQIWDFRNGTPELSQGSGDLATNLGYSSQIPPKFTKTIDNTVHDYESVIKRWMLDALGTVSHSYRDKDRSPENILQRPLMSQTFAAASDLARQGKDAQGRSRLSSELKNLGLGVEDAKISEVLAASFMCRANEVGENTEVCWAVAQRLLPSLEQKIEAQRELTRGNKLRDQNKVEEAESAYNRAVALDPTLRSNLKPEEEARKGNPATPRDSLAEPKG